jgi:hypothetical protein
MDSNRSLDNYSPRELEAASALLEVFGRPIQFDPARWTAEASTEDEIPAGEVEMADAPTDSIPSLTTDQPQATIPSESSTKAWFHDLLDRIPLKNFMRFGLRPAQLDEEGERRLEAVLVEMPERSCIQEAAWYLEENEWSVEDAIKQYKKDEAARRNTNNATYQQALQAANSVTKQSFSQDLLEFRIKETVGTRRYKYPNSKEFNVDNPNHLRSLNHWLADMTRVRGPLPVIPAASGSDRNWKAGEERYLQNLYADKKDDFAVGKLPDMAKMIEELNSVTVGRYMPGRTNPCSARTVTSANAWLDRTWKKDDQGNRVAQKQRYASALRILKKQEEEEAEYSQFVK